MNKKVITSNSKTPFNEIYPKHKIKLAKTRKYKPSQIWFCLGNGKYSLEEYIKGYRENNRALRIEETKHLYMMQRGRVKIKPLF